MRFVLILSTALAVATAAAADPSRVLEANRVATHGVAAPAPGTVEIDYAYAGQGMTGKVRTAFDRQSGAFVDSADIGPTTGANGFDGKEAWMRDMSGAVTPQAGGDTRQLAVNEAWRDANLWWRPGQGGAVVTQLDGRTEGGARFDVLRITPAGGKPFEAWFDVATYLLARTVEAQGSQTITSFYSDWKATAPEGPLLPGKVVVDDGSGEQYRQVQTLTAARLTAPRPPAAWSPPKAELADATIANPEGRTTLPFRLINNHIYAQVRVNGKGPYTFIFDTGGHDLLTPDTAKSLNIGSEGAAPGQGAGEGIVDVGFARKVTFQIGDLTLKDQTIAVLPFEAAQVEGFDEQGMIGFEVFRRFVTQIDYGARTLTFIDPAKFDPKGAGTAVPFVFYSHLPQVQGGFEGIPARFDIDTGSRVEVTLTRPFVEEHGLIASHPKGVAAVDGWGVGGRSRSYVTRARFLTLGPVRIDDLVAGMAVQKKGAFADPAYQGNVGSGLLKRFVVTFDYDRQVMYLKPLASPPADRATFDRAGMWINTSAQGFEIMDLTAGGPAAEAGLKVGDQITTVDGAPAGSIPISDMRGRLRTEKAGATLSLGVMSGGKPATVSVTLRDQI